MLSFNTVHVLTDSFIHLQRDDRPQPPSEAAPLGTLTLVQDYRSGSPTSDLRQLSLLHLALFARRLHTLPAALHHLAAALTDPSSDVLPDGHLPLDGLDVLTAALHGTQPGQRLLAWAICYDTVDVDTNGLTPLRRVDAVDADGRLYQLRRRPHDNQPMITVDDQPQPSDLPATYLALAQLAAIRPSPTGRRP